MPVILKNWYVFQRGGDFQAPELRASCLHGNAYGHPRFDDGSPVNTSRIVNVEDKGEYKAVTTISGSVYHCYKEDVDPGAEERYPGYFERLSMKREGE